MRNPDYPAPPSAPMDRVALQRPQILLAVGRLSLITTLMLGAAFFAAAQLAFEFPLLMLLSILGVYIVCVLIALWLRGRGALEWAARVYLIASGLNLLAMSYFVGGSTGPLHLLFLPLVVIAALISGRGAALGSSIGFLVLTVVWVLLESFGLLQPYPLTPAAARLLTPVALLLAFGVTVGLLTVFLRFSEAGLAASRQRDAELSSALARAEAAIGAEMAAREQAALAIEQLQQSVQEYSAFLTRVADGDFSARLDLDALAKQVESPALLSLGAELNRTVETLVTTLTELRVVQQRYLQEAWAMFLETEKGRRGFRAREAQVEVTAPTWLPPMTAAVEGQRSVVQAGELAVPIAVRGEVVGALGARRTDGQPWTAEELAMIEAVMDQLGQTLETLRLVEETQRQAQREQVLGDLSVRFSRSFDVDMLLQQAVVDLGRLLNLDEVSVYVEPAPSEPDAAADDKAMQQG